MTAKTNPTKNAPNPEQFAVKLRAYSYLLRQFRAFRDVAPGAADRVHFHLQETLREDVKGMMLQMTTSVLENTRVRTVNRETKVPASWWDHIKQTIRDQAPTWLARRLRVYTDSIETRVTIEEHRVCPHLPFARKSAHISYLAYLDPAAVKASDQAAARPETFPPVVCIVAGYWMSDTHRAELEQTAAGAIVIKATGEDAALDRAKVEMSTDVLVMQGPKDRTPYTDALLCYARGLGKPVTTWEDTRHA